ncbi:MAG: ATP-binding protein [Albidovulum sp.]|nr:ATP-binding protein [Albidovulum sp.]
MSDITAKKAKASPTKEFFVNMITRDITLEDSILDLIDNSIDAAWQMAGSHAMTLGDDTDLSAFKITLTLSEDQFTISDNCGGMTLDNAVDHAFSFGRKASQEREEFSIGVYGIGMKRAVFKLGKNVRVRSQFRGDNGSPLSFAVPINVTDWLADERPSWDFDIVEDDVRSEYGVVIIVNELTWPAKTAFGNPAFVENLRRMIARDYSLHLGRGLKIEVGDEQIIGANLELAMSEDFSPMRISYEDKQDGESVSIEMLGGMAAPPPDSVEPDDRFDGDKRFGWYVACNGRIVMAADKSSIAGWGTKDWPQWHRQYAGFIGIVLFSASNTAALPLTTTKRSVDQSSDVYRSAQLKMRDLSKVWIAYTNQRKQALEEAKRKEAAARAVPISLVEVKPAIALPSLNVQRVERPANVHYSVPVQRMKRLARALGNINLTYREVGVRSFEYTYDDFVGDE